MNEQPRNGDATQEQSGDSSARIAPPGLDLQYAELMETVWACERTWNQNDRIDAAIRYGR
jgi:hypothetical protein